MGAALPPLLYRYNGRSERFTYRLRHSEAEQFVLIDLIVDAVKIRTPNDLASVKERDAFAFRDVPIALAEKDGLFLPALEHLRIAGELGDRGRRDQQDFWRPAVRALAIGASEKDQTAHALGNVEGR